MTQIAIIQAAPQSAATPPSLPKNTIPNQFSPYLEKAVTETTQTTSGNTSVYSTPYESQVFTDSVQAQGGEIFQDTSTSTAMTADVAAQQIDASFIAILSLADKTETSSLNSPISTDESSLVIELTEQQQLAVQASDIQSPLIHVEHEQFSNINTLFFSSGQGQLSNIKTTISPSGQGESAKFPEKVLTTIQAAAESLSPEAAGWKANSHAIEESLPIAAIEKNEIGSSHQKSIFSAVSGKADVPPFLTAVSTNSADVHLPIEITGKGAQKNSNLPPPAAHSQALLSQLQQIINQGHETKKVSIQITVNDSQQYPDEAAAKPGIIFPGLIHETVKYTEKTGSKMPALRMDMLAQYFEAKMKPNEGTDFGANTQSSDQQNKTGSEQFSVTPQPNSSLSPEQADGFQHISTLMQESQTNQTQNTVKPVILPSGTVVNEDNVIQQVVERFQINNRGNDTKLSLQLHPEELGELKIDLTLKEGSIKANVVAHSQQALEIIERNMVKLRNSLEDHGFTIDEILVTSESDTVPDFDFFEQQLSQQSEFMPTVTHIKKENDFDGVLEDAKQSADASTGVNIKA